MSNCKFCGQPAGFLRSQHRECAERHSDGRKQIIQAIAAALVANKPSDTLATSIASVANESLVSEEEQKALLISGWCEAVGRFLEDGVLDEEEQRRLTAFRDQFALSRDALDASGMYTKAVKASVLREIMHGNVPEHTTAGSPFNFQKGECLAWSFENTDYLEDRVRKTYVGRSAGVSVRIAKGVYYRTSTFRGHPVEQTSRVRIDTGTFAATTKNLYFAGSQKSVRIPYAKIVSFQPFENGLGVVRDAASAKPQIFITGDGWFTYNLVVNLARL
jgi:hypothetical protein